MEITSSYSSLNNSVAGCRICCTHEQSSKNPVHFSGAGGGPLTLDFQQMSTHVYGESTVRPYHRNQEMSTLETRSSSRVYSPAMASYINAPNADYRLMQEGGTGIRHGTSSGGEFKMPKYNHQVDPSPLHLSDSSFNQKPTPTQGIEYPFLNYSSVGRRSGPFYSTSTATALGQGQQSPHHLTYSNYPRSFPSCPNLVTAGIPDRHAQSSWMLAALPTVPVRTRRHPYSERQIRELEKGFADNRYLNEAKRARLAQQVNLSERQVKIWYQNRRMKQKREDKREKKKINNRFLNQY